MAVFDVILRNRTVVPDDLFRQIIGGVMLLEQRATLVLLVRQNRLDGALIPHVFALRRFDTHLCQLPGDSLEGEPLEEFSVYNLHGLRLLRVDHELTVLSAVVAEENRKRRCCFSISKPLTLAPGDVERNGPALFLGEAGHDGQQELALTVKGPYVLLLEIDLGAMLLQFPNGRQAVDRVSCKPADRLCENESDAACQRILHHAVETVAPAGRCAGDAFVTVPSCRHSPASRQYFPAVCPADRNRSATASAAG